MRVVVGWNSVPADLHLLHGPPFQQTLPFPGLINGWAYLGTGLAVSTLLGELGHLFWVPTSCLGGRVADGDTHHQHIYILRTAYEIPYALCIEHTCWGVLRLWIMRYCAGMAADEPPWLHATGLARVCANSSGLRAHNVPGS